MENRTSSPVDADDRQLKARILATSLALAEEKGAWAEVRLVDVAERLAISPSDVTDYFRDLDSVANAWFQEGLKAMLAPKAADFAEAPAIDRLETCLLAWFDKMAQHREVTTQMLSGKLHLSHPHHWVPMVFDLSRLIHWLREAALLPASYGTRRASLEEIGLTGLFLATLNVWRHDTAPGQQRTREFLRRQLERSEDFVSAIYKDDVRQRGRNVQEAYPFKTRERAAVHEAKSDKVPGSS
jgi:AcrR family transcriptional regulator